MLVEQYRVWSSYPEDLTRQVEIVIGDDSSPERIEDVPRPTGLPPLTLFRLADVEDAQTPPWRQDAIRNRAVDLARGPWLFLSDMDHVLPAESLRAVLALTAGEDRVYGFQRLDAPHLMPKRDAQGNLHPHPNTYAMTKARYLALGGYDEEFCGTYGTDGYYRRKVLTDAPYVHLEKVHIVRYSRDVIADASTPTREARDQARQPGVVQRRLVEKAEQKIAPITLSIPWERVA
jgi:hypothetical protein